MRRSVFLVLMTGLLMAADAPNPQGGEDRLQGTWYIVSVNRPGDKGGRESLDFKDNRFTLNFDRGTVTSIGEGKLLWQGTYRLDPGVNSRRHRHHAAFRTVQAGHLSAERRHPDTLPRLSGQPKTDEAQCIQGFPG